LIQPHHFTVEGEDERRAIDQIADRLGARFPDLPGEIIVKVVDDVHRELDGRPIRAFVPILVEKAANERLRNVSRLTG
jgi:hypothetical protein